MKSVGSGSQKQQIRKIMLYAAVGTLSAFSAGTYFSRIFEHRSDTNYYELMATALAVIAILWVVNIYRLLKKAIPPSA